MTRASVLLVSIVLVASTGAAAQTPAGGIAGRVTDATGASVPRTSVSIVNQATDLTRSVVTNDDGLFNVPALIPGRYRVVFEAPGFKRAERTATVGAGTTVTVDVALQLGDVAEAVTVSAPRESLRRDHHQVGGMIAREQMERLPLNGRNFLDLAKVEPGVIPSRLPDGRMFVSSLGAGLQTIPRIGTTRITVDGANLSTPGTAGVLLQLSPDVVQEFQVATVNFDAATSPTTNGAINVVTRSGTNEFRGQGFILHRDHHLAAYPGLSRDPGNPDPFFRRYQFGLSGGGPIRRRTAFFFGSFERTDQEGVASVQPRDEFAGLGGIFSTPYAGNQFSGRLDAQLHRNHLAFVRYTEDRNKAFASTTGPSVLPSGWSWRSNEAQQAAAAVSSVVSRSIVNDLRASYFGWSATLTSPGAEDCRGCFGLGEVRTVIPGVAAGPGLVFGGQGTSSSASGWRVQVTDSVTWQTGKHTVGLGFDWEHVETTSFNLGVQSGEISLFSPAQTRQTLPNFPLPDAFRSPADVLRLPVRDFSIAVGSGTVLWQGFRPERTIKSYRAYVSDTWRAGARVNLNIGLGWSYEPDAYSHDLSKPSLVAPLLGTAGLGPPARQRRNFSPAAGFVWTATADGRTVVRGGAGRYFDPASSTNALNLVRERHLLSPLGTGTLTVTGANIPHEGGTLQFVQPTAFTGIQLLAILPTIRETLLRTLNPDNRDFSIRNLDGAKQGTNLQDPWNRTPSAWHVGIGVQRELATSIVVSADLVWKRFVNTFINGIDYNRWGSAAGPVMPRCTPQQREDLYARCSNGPLFFDTTSGRAQYLGLLLRAEKRFSGRTQFQASYALGSFVGSNGTGTGTSEAAGGRVFGFNNDDWRENYGPLPTDQRHMLNLSGVIELPLRIRLAGTVSAYSAPPFAPYIGDLDFNGDGTTNDLLPGTRVNQFRRSRDKEKLTALVEEYNRQFAGRGSPSGRVMPIVTLPDRYALNDTFFTQDLRLTRTFSLRGDRHRAEAFVEVFNLFNTPNLIGFGSDLRQANAFGQPSSRFGQVFGSGGPRAFQLGARLSF